MTHVLQIDDLHVSYGRKPVLRGLSLGIAEGETYGLLGASGSGKSTVALATLHYLPSEAAIERGRIRIGGRDLYSLSPDELRLLRVQQVAAVYQNPGRALNPTMRIGDQVAEVFELQGASRAEAQSHALSALRRVALVAPERVMRSYPFELSGGMQQRVVIAMAIAAQPRLLILDEPTTGLDATVEAGILDLIERLRGELSTAILLISHDIGVVRRMCSHIGVLIDGQLVEQGAAHRVLETPQDPRVAALLRPESGAKQRRARTSSDSDAPVCLRATHVHKTFASLGRGVAALKDVSLSLRVGTTLAVVGESGSGKSTLARLLVGLEQPDSNRGSVELDGEDVGHASERRREQLSALRFVAQNPDTALNRAHTVRYALSRALLKAGVKRSELREQTLSLLRLVRLDEEHLDRLPRQLSGGQKQRVAIACAFAGQPRVVVLDEPTSSLDPIAQSAILDLLVDLQAQQGVSYLLITHDMAVVRRLADSIAVMYRGEVVEFGDAAQVLDAPRHAYTRELLQATVVDPFNDRSRRTA
ncbi:MAG TPA: ABC transporter ATP-binding protein [Steroidobacter sp.]|nr:ABC transporter ATP-binding protein [Steroidobacter sp.]